MISMILINRSGIFKSYNVVNVR